MRTFTDANGETWTITVNVSAIKNVLKLLPGVNLAEIEQGDPPLIVRLSTDIMLVADVLYALCEEQCQAKELTDEQFGRRLGGDSLFAAMDALLDELTDFFRLRPHIVRMIQKQQTAVRAAIREATAQIETLDVEAHVAKAFGNSSTNAPGSSA